MGCIEYIWRNCFVHEISYEEYLEIHAQLKKLAGRVRDNPMVGDPLTEMLILIGDNTRFRAHWLDSLYSLVDKARKEYLKGVIDRKVEQYLREGMRQKDVYNSVSSFISFLGQVVFYVKPRVRQGLMQYLQKVIKTTAQNIRA